MPNLIEDALTGKLAAWLDANRPDAIPPMLPIHVANRDELRTRPCIVLATSEAKPVSGLRHTARIRLDAHLFSQADDTPADTHAEWAAALADVLHDVAALRTGLDSSAFRLHDLLPRDSATTPDETRGRETLLSYEAVVSAA